jgi:hypothetical protein
VEADESVPSCVNREWKRQSFALVRYPRRSKPVFEHVAKAAQSRVNNFGVASLQQMSAKSRAAPYQVSRSALHVRVIAYSEQGIADLRQGTAGILQHQNYRGCLRASRSGSKSASGESVTLIVWRPCCEAKPEEGIVGQATSPLSDGWSTGGTRVDQLPTLRLGTIGLKHWE